MSKLTDEFIELKCPNCGGKVQLTNAQIEEHFVEMPDGTYMYIGVEAQKEGAVCAHCGTEFVRKQHIELHGLPMGGTMIVGGDLVGRDKITTLVNTGSGAIATGGGVAAGQGGVVIRGRPKKKAADDDEDDEGGVWINGRRVA